MAESRWQYAGEHTNLPRNAPRGSRSRQRPSSGMSSNQTETFATIVRRRKPPTSNGETDEVRSDCPRLRPNIGVTALIVEVDQSVYLLPSESQQRLTFDEKHSNYDAFRGSGTLYRPRYNQVSNSQDGGWKVEQFPNVQQDQRSVKNAAIHCLDKNDIDAYDWFPAAVSFDGSLGRPPTPPPGAWEQL
jgi:hypothetical protein